ncbi:MAG: hypothetical protein AMXMBFR64_24950 [Myxococcales bacterium]
MRRAILLLVAILGGCVEPPVDHAMTADDQGARSGAVTCGPLLERYPVAGPHNGGWDKNALSYSCPPHPGGSPDNSDFIGGNHYGNDIFAALGTPVVAPRGGTIVKSGYTSVGGNRVTVKDGCGWYYYHAHLDQIEPGVVVGKQVKAGDKIGTVGKTGSAQGTSPHLHFSIYPDDAYESGIDPYPLLKAVDHTACGSCKAHCEGSVIVGADCGKGDCAVYGANCVDDALGVRCVFGACPATGTVKVCLDDHKIGTCKNGQIEVGDCGAFGAYCSTAGAAEARCVVVFCVDSPKQAPWVHDVCLPDGERYTCEASGGITPKPCGAGKHCSAVGGVHCESGGCPASGEADVCLGDTIMAHCSGGKVTSTGDCGAFGAWCSTAGGTKPHCVSAFCVESPKGVPKAHDICFLDGQRYACDASGGITAKPCPAGQACVDAPSVHCAAPCDAAAEVCNGKDDDCDGDVDEGCPPPCTPGSEVCNGKDDDCDGSTDEGYGVGEPCQVGEGPCASQGVVGCTEDGGALCEAAPVGCDDGDPCTVDGCDPTVGCVSGPVEGCCSAATPCGPGQQCHQGTCAKVLCLPCESDVGCGAGGRCVELGGGRYCLVPCQGGLCPDAFACQSVDGELLCVPDAGDCACGPATSARCEGNARRRVDGCGRGVGDVEHCERGCGGGVCCPVGTAASGGVCVAGGSGGGSGGAGWGGGGAEAVDGSGGDAVGALAGDTGPTSGGGSGFGASVTAPADGGVTSDGCGAGGTSAGAWGALWLAAVAVGRALRRRGSSGGQGKFT